MNSKYVKTYPFSVDIFSYFFYKSTDKNNVFLGFDSGNRNNEICHNVIFVGEDLGRPMAWNALYIMFSDVWQIKQLPCISIREKSAADRHKQ